MYFINTNNVSSQFKESIKDNMKLKIVYVLTSSESDYYLEQTMISIKSLRMYNSDVDVVLVLDKKTNDNLINNRRNILNDIEELITINTPDKFSNVQSSRYIKTSLRQHIRGDYLFIDGDTIICDTLSDIKTIDSDLSMVLDRHMQICQHQHADDIIKWAREIGWHTGTKYFNSGVFFVRDSEIAYKFYDQWHKEWLKNCDKGFPRDQPSMGKADNILGGVLTELPSEWNCQIVENGLAYLDRAKIIHYFSSNNSEKNPCPYLLANKKYYRQIRENGYTIPDNIEQMLHNPKALFVDKTTILSGNDTYFFNTPLIRFLKNIYYSHPSTFYKIQKSAQFIKHPFRRN